MKTLIFLSALVISTIDAEEITTLVVPTDRWLTITEGRPTVTQLLIQYQTESGGLSRLISEKAETFSSYEGFRLSVAKTALGLVNLVRQPLTSNDNSIWPESLRFQIKTKVETVEKFAIDVNMGNPQNITLETILLLFPNTLGSIISMPEMTGLTIDIGENPPTTTTIPVIAGIAVLDNVSPYPNQRIRYHITLGEGDNARIETYTQHRTRVSPPEITMTQWVEDYSDWWMYYWDENEYPVPPPTQYYYAVRVTYLQGLDITLESSEDTSLWNFARSQAWNTETTSMEAWFNVTNQPRLFFRAHAK